jgi:hypothetical protein
MPEQPPEFSLEDPPDWIIEFVGHGLPHGRSYSIRMLITEVANHGIANIHLSPRYRGDPNDERDVSIALEESERVVLLD